MAEIDDFTDTELWIIRNAVNERYGTQIELMFADSELRLEKGSTVLTVCPTVVWQERGSNLVVFKAGDERYRAQFYYKGSQQFGTGKKEYADLAECVITLLQVQADHEKLAVDEKPAAETDSDN